MNRQGMKLLTTFFCALFLVLSAGWAKAADDGCQVLIRKTAASQRTLLLNDGDAWSLFQQYVSEAEKQSVKLNLAKVKVVLVTNRQKKEYGVDWKQLIRGDSKKEIWARMLKNVKAESDEAVMKEAARQQWDMVCYAASDVPAPQARAATAERAKAGTSIPLEAKQHFQQGMQYAARRDFTNARKEFTNAIEKCPTYAAAYSNRGVAYMQQKKFDLAEDDLKKAVELGPKDGKNHYNLACWYALQRQTGRGVASLDAALAAGFSDYEALRKDRDLANLRKTADWQKTLDKHKIFLGAK